MHSIDLSKYSLRTDLIIEHKKNNNYHTTKEVIGNITVEKTINNQHKEHYTTISFDDVTDRDNFQKVEQVFTINLKKYLEDINLKEIDPVLVIGLGNEKSTPDSLGPKTVKQVLVTNYLFELGEVEPGYQKTSSFAPSVTSITGIETSRAIKSLISTTEAKLLIVIDALAASSINRLNKTIQITDTGIHPGSGVGNNRKELTKNTLGIPVIAIGVPTVVDATTIVADTFKYIIKHFSYKLNNINNHKLKLVPPDKQNYLNENSSLDDNVKKDLLGEIGNLNESDFKQLINEVLLPINYNLMVTPTEIDFIIEKLGLLIGNGINKSLHQKLNSTNN
jgi:spore protease